MITIEEVNELSVGDEIDTDHTLFKGLPKFPVLLRLVEIKQTPKGDWHTMTFVATWIGITLGRWNLIRDDKDKLTWSLR